MKMDEMRVKKTDREQMPRKWRGNGGEKDQNCNGGLHLKPLSIMHIENNEIFIALSILMLQSVTEVKNS